VKRLTLDSYRDVVMRLLRRRAGSDVYIWRLHDGDDNSQVAARVLSIRAMDGYVAKGEPNVGNRLLVHALVKFDTKQVHLPSSTRRYCFDSDSLLSGFRVCRYIPRTANHW
jgi:hypothetical protein